MQKIGGLSLDPHRVQGLLGHGPPGLSGGHRDVQVGLGPVKNLMKKIPAILYTD